MKLLVVIDSLAPGGAERMVSYLVPGMRKKGIDVSLLVLRGKDDFFKRQMQEQKVMTHELEVNSLYSPFNLLKIWPYFKSADIIHVHLFPALYFIGILKWMTARRLPIFFTEHSTSNRRRRHWFYRLCDRWVYRRYDHVISVSKDVEKSLDKHLGGFPKGHSIISNGVPLEQISHAKPLNRSKLGLSSDAIILIQVARFSKEKDQWTTIKSLEYLPANIHLLLIGDGPKRAGLETQTSKLKYSDRVHFLGIREDIPALLKAADIAVISSKYEGMSLSALEAMAAGLVVIGSRVKGVEGLLDRVGLLFDYGDAEGLAKLILGLAEDPELYGDVREACLRRATQFDISTIIEQHIKLYENGR